MTLQQFIKKFDKKNAVVLLEGKRKVAPKDKIKLINLGKLLAAKTKNINFRSGNAEGADFYFTSGVAKINTERLQVLTPYTGHREKKNNSYETFSLDKMNLAMEEKIICQSKTNKKTEKLIDQFIAGNKNRITIKAAYIIRDTIKVTGINEIRPANFALFYDDLKKPRTGGTGHTMNVCDMNNVEFINQNTWMNWLHE